MFYSITTRPSIFREIEKTFEEFDSFLGNPLEKTSTYPKVNVIDKTEEFEIVAATPGLDKEDLEISAKEHEVEGNKFVCLIIKGTSKQEEKDSNYLMRELKKSSFRRQLYFKPGKVDMLNITSSYKNGELRIKVPKLKEPVKESVSIKIN